MKNMLKPTFLKVFLALTLFILLSWLWRMGIKFIISDTFPYGVPFPFFLAWGPCRPGENCSEFNGLYLVLDIVIWYMASAWLVSRFRRGKPDA